MAYDLNIYISLIGRLSNGFSIVNEIWKSEGVEEKWDEETVCRFVFIIGRLSRWNEFCQRGVKVSRSVSKTGTRETGTWRSDQFAWPRVVLRDSPVIDCLRSSFSIDNTRSRIMFQQTFLQNYFPENLYFPFLTIIHLIPFDRSTQFFHDHSLPFLFKIIPHRSGSVLRVL